MFCNDIYRSHVLYTHINTFKKNKNVKFLDYSILNGITGCTCETLNNNMILLSSTIWCFSPAGRSEHSLSRKHDPRIDDTRDRWPGHEKNWPGEEHADGHEAQSGSYLYFALYQCLCYHYSLLLKLLCLSSVFRCLTQWADRRWWIPKVIWQISTPWSPHMEVTSGAPTGDTLV